MKPSASKKGGEVFRSPPAKVRETSDAFLDLDTGGGKLTDDAVSEGYPAFLQIKAQ